MREHFPAYHERRLSDGTHVFVATTGGGKRDGLSLDMTGGDFTNYLRNPVFLWAHDYQGQHLPIGRTVRLVPSKTRLRAHVQFDQADEFAREVERKFDEGYLSAVSVGWMDLERDAKGVITRWDLLDISAVPVPGDPDALIERELALVRSFIAEHEDPEEDPDEDFDDEEDHRRAAIPPHTTPKADEDDPWDASREVGQADGEEQLRRMHAWVDDDTDPDTKQAYKLPHHRADGTVVWRGVAAAMARLLQSATLIPEADRKRVWDHLERHYRQFDKTAPELRSAEGFPAPIVAGMFYHDEWAHYRAELAQEMADRVDALEHAIVAFKATDPVEPAPEPDPDLEALAQLADTLKEIEL